MCDKSFNFTNGFTGIYEIDFQIIMDLWLKKIPIDGRENVDQHMCALMTMFNLYNTCHYFRNIFDEPIYFRQFQLKIGYKLYDRFADILNSYFDALNDETVG
jgi:hypothetical protein